MLLVLWMVTGSLNFYVISLICYWCLWTSVSDLWGFKSDEYGILMIQTIIVFIISLYYLKKKIHFCAFFVLPCFVFYKDWVFVFFFNPWIDIYTIIAISFLVNVLSFWMVQLHFESIDVCFGALAWFHWSLVVFKPFLLTALVFAGTLSFIVIIITIIIIGVAICIS